MDYFLDEANKEDLYQFLSLKYIQNLDPKEFEAMILQFRQSNMDNDLDINQLNEKFLDSAVKLTQTQTKTQAQVQTQPQPQPFIGSIPQQQKRKFIGAHVSMQIPSGGNSSNNNNLRTEFKTGDNRFKTYPNDNLKGHDTSSYESNNVYANKKADIYNPYFQPQVNPSMTSFASTAETTKDQAIHYNSFHDGSKELECFQEKNKGDHDADFVKEKGLSSDANLSLYSSQFEVPSAPKYFPTIEKSQHQEIHLICNSRDRDVTKFPFHDYFQIELSKVVRNIVKIKCVNVILPNLNFFEFEPFLFLQIYEFDQIYEGSQLFYSKMFAQILATNEPPAQRFITCDTVKSSKKFYNNPLASLSRMTVRLCKSNGAPLPLPTDVFQIVSVENAIYENGSIYRITVLNQPRNLNGCFYEWLKASCHIFDPIYITGLPEVRQELYYLDFEMGALSPECPIIIYASSLKVTKRLFSDINFCSLGATFANCLCSFNKIAVSVQLNVKYQDVDTKFLHSTIVK
jgi:hypothetical protein